MEADYLSIGRPDVRRPEAIARPDRLFEFGKESYYNTGVADGTQRFVKVQVAGRRKGVYCNNFFPPTVEKLKSFIDDRVLTKQQAVIAAATDVTATYRGDARRSTANEAVFLDPRTSDPWAGGGKEACDVNSNAIAFGFT